MGESMREQMDRERDNFFRGVNPRDWPNEGTASRGGFFNRPRTSFAGFPSGPGLRGARYASDFPPADELEGFGLLPGSEASRQRKSSGGSGACGPEDEGSDQSSSGFPEQESIPIKVVHERGPVVRHKYNTARNTTELPAKASTGGSESHGWSEQLLSRRTSLRNVSICQ